MRHGGLVSFCLEKEQQMVLQVVALDKNDHVLAAKVNAGFRV